MIANYHPVDWSEQYKYQSIYDEQYNSSALTSTLTISIPQSNTNITSPSFKTNPKNINLSQHCDHSVKEKGSENNKNNQIQPIFQPQKHLSIIQSTYLLSGEMVIELDWIKDTLNENQIELSIQPYKQVIKTCLLKQNNSMVIQIDSKENSVQQFKFLTQFLLSLGNAKAMYLGKLLQQYQVYAEEKQQNIKIRSEEIVSQIDLSERREISMKEYYYKLSQLKDDEFASSYFGTTKENDFLKTISQSYTSALIELMGLSPDEMSKVILKKGNLELFDSQTRFKMTMGRLMLIQQESSQRRWSVFEGDIVTCDGFRLRAQITNELSKINEDLFLYYSDSQPGVKRYAFIDFLCVMRLQFDPNQLKLLMQYRTTREAIQRKREFLEEEDIEASAFSSIFLERFYKNELISMGYKKKKIRKTKALAQEEMKHFFSKQKNKFVITQKN